MSVAICLKLGPGIGQLPLLWQDHMGQSQHCKTHLAVSHELLLDNNYTRTELRWFFNYNIEVFLLLMLKNPTFPDPPGSGESKAGVIIALKPIMEPLLL